jgi:hypothetical protein
MIKFGLKSLAQNTDFLLVIDSDEYMAIDKSKFFRNLDKIKESKTSPYVDGNDNIVKDKPDV